MDSDNIEPAESLPETTLTHSLPNYQIKETIGKGTFGKVKAAIHIPTAEMVAIKIIGKLTIKDEDDRQRLNREVDILRMVRHPNIVQLYEIIETDEFIYLVMEYVEQGELFKLMTDEVRLTQRAAGRIFIQIMNAVEYLHRLDIAHRDLKPQNILMDVDYNIKLIDFGLSNFYVKNNLLMTACGSPCYAPPEMVAGNHYNGKIGDLWSMGIIFYGMICGSLPFEQSTTKQLYKKVIQGFYVIPSDISLEAIEVIRKILLTDPAQRITIPELRQLKFFQSLTSIENKIIGIVVGFHPMPIDNEIIAKMENYIPFKKEQAESQIKQNRQTQLTTLYYLLQKKSLREGNKTVVDLQLFLETHEKYKSQYGILPNQKDSFNLESYIDDSQKQTIKKEPKKQLDGKTERSKSIRDKSKDKKLKIEKKQNVKEKVNHFTSVFYLTNRKGLSRQKKRPPLSIVKSKKIEGETEGRIQKSIQNKTINIFSRKNRLKTYLSPDKQQKSSRGRHSQENSSEKKKSLKKSKTKHQNKLALNLWDAYFQKPLEATIKNQTQGITSRKVKIKEQQVQKNFQQNLNRLKNGFLKLPTMKKDRESTENKGSKS